MILASMCDAVLVVVRSARTRRQMLCRVHDLLGRFKVGMAGIVVNDLDLNSSEHYGYYGYYGDACNEPNRDKALKI